MRDLEKTLSFSSAIPKINDVSNYLKGKTGFQLKPVPGMVDQREFLNCLAFRVFCSAQFVRHQLSLDCAAEPDLIHDFVGHVPMLADSSIAGLTQKIGLLSLGASDEDIKRLGYAYVYTIELGLCLEDGKQKAFGAAIASCAADLKKIEEDTHTWKEFEPEVDCQTEIASFQKPFECFYLSKSIEKATQSLLNVGDKMEK
jgi:phenylalanine-4-hydroxylase